MSGKEDLSPLQQLAIAVAEDDVETVEGLLNIGLGVNSLMKFIDHTIPAVTKMFNVIRFHESYIYTFPILAYAITNASLNVLKTLIKHGAPINARYFGGQLSPLHMAIIQNNIPMIELLLDSGANVDSINSDENTAMMFVILSDISDIQIKEKIIKLILKANPDLSIQNDDHLTALHLAAKMGDKDALNILFQEGANANMRNSEGRTPLMYRISGEIAECLIEHGGDPNHKDPEGVPCLDYAIVQQAPEVASVLIKAGADVNATYSRGMTPLFKALLCWVHCVVEELVEHGANIAYVNIRKRGAMYYAATIPDPHMCNYLMSKGASLELVSDDGTTPLYTAVSRHNCAVAMFLLKMNVDHSGAFFHDDEYMTILDVAIHEGLVSVVDHLIDIGSKRRYYKTIFQVKDDGMWPNLQKEFFPKPRTMQDLARNKIRDVLGSRLTEALQILHLPERLAEIISMKHSLSFQ